MGLRHKHDLGTKKVGESLIPFEIFFLWVLGWQRPEYQLNLLDWNRKKKRGRSSLI